jgi:outer membrane protein
MKNRLALRLAALAAVAITGFTLPSSAQGPDVPEQLDLRTAIEFALDNNFAIQQARERIREQEGLVVEVRAQALPNLAINSSYTLTDSGLNESFGPQPLADQNWRLALEVRQTLYAGGRVRGALEAQRLLRESALLDLESTVQLALLEVRTRFYDVLLARDQIEVEEQNLDLLRQQLQTARNRFEAGSASQFEVLRAEVELANAQPALIRTRNRFRTAIDELRQVIGYTSQQPQNLRKTPEFVGSLDFQPVHYNLESALAAARENRPELQRLSRIREAQEAAVHVERARYRPDLALVGGYEVRNSMFSDRLSDSRDGWFAGVQSTWSIFDGRATAGRLAQARSRVRQAQLQQSEQELGVEVEVRRALSSLQEAEELAEAAGRVVEQAEEALRLADARHAAGTITQLDVLQARVALTSARTNQLVANYSFNVALATLRRAMGAEQLIVVDN